MTDRPWEADDRPERRVGSSLPEPGYPPRRADPGWEALRETVWEPGQSPRTAWGQTHGTWMDQPGPAVSPEDTAEVTTVPPTAVTAAVPSGEEHRESTTRTRAVTSSRPGAHKVVPRPTAAHRVAASDRGIRPSQAPYRTGAVRRIRSAFTLILLSLVLAGLFAAVAVAVVAGIASAISHAATS